MVWLGEADPKLTRLPTVVVMVTVMRWLPLLMRISLLRMIGLIGCLCMPLYAKNSFVCWLKLCSLGIMQLITYSRHVFGWKEHSWMFILVWIHQYVESSSHWLSTRFLNNPKLVANLCVPMSSSSFMFSLLLFKIHQTYTSGHQIIWKLHFNHLNVIDILNPSGIFHCHSKHPDQRV